MFKHLVQFAAMVAVVGWARGVTLAGATWNGQPYSLTMPTHISAIGQASTGSINLPLQHDSACNISVSVAQAGNEVLTHAGQTLTTYYKLTGAALQGDADATWVTSSDFLTHVYHIASTGPMDTLTLSVKATVPANSAPPAGDYNASIILTVTW